MKSLLFTLGLALCCFLQAEGEDVTANTKEHLGRWVNIATACSSEDHLEQLRSMPMFVADLSEPEKDVFSISVLLPMLNNCKKIIHKFIKGEDGKYRSISDGTKVTVESVKLLEAHKNVVISTISIEDSDKKFTTTNLHHREATQDPEVLQKFKDECKKQGYTDDQIVVFSPPVRCQ